MRRERDVNKEKEKVDETRKRDRQVEAMECKPLPLQHITYPTPELTVHIHQTHNPNRNPSLQKQNLQAGLRKVSFPLPMLRSGSYHLY